MELLRGLNREQGITILMVTHEPEMAEYAQRIVHFVDGRVDSDDPQRGETADAVEHASCSPCGRSGAT